MDEKGVEEWQVDYALGLGVPQVLMSVGPVCCMHGRWMQSAAGFRGRVRTKQVGQLQSGRSTGPNSSWGRRLSFHSAFFFYLEFLSARGRLMFLGSRCR